MIFIWQGYGFWVGLMPFTLVATLPFMDYIHKYSIKPYYILIIEYLVLAYVGFKLHSKNPRKYLNKKTNEVFEVDEMHQFFFIKMEYWSIFILVILSYLFFKN